MAESCLEDNDLQLTDKDGVDGPKTSVELRIQETSEEADVESVGVCDKDRDSEEDGVVRKTFDGVPGCGDNQGEFETGAGQRWKCTCLRRFRGGLNTATERERRQNFLRRLGKFWVGVLWAVTLSEFCVVFSASRTVRTKYGDVSGVIATPDNRYLDAVEVFRGVPYASPPVGSLRFMPPVTGAQWSGVKMANRFSPVCPQALPDVRNETAALRRMPRGRLEHLRRILPYLHNQSEDCLYLNIYAPAHGE